MARKLLLKPCPWRLTVARSRILSPLLFPAGSLRLTQCAQTPNIVQKNQRNKNKPIGFSPNPPKNLVSGAIRGFADAIDGCPEK
ncbi:hypothetical protein C1H46_010600 [Malus baccata]|uniref:Uncharacterized protein n=1 Tax=Malus baccata TaxID=106549 RepID=A0A540MZW0_MALBA|nr:hypothetical protein C1H46_010600 [Malus baccata]